MAIFAPPPPPIKTLCTLHTLNFFLLPWCEILLPNFYLFKFIEIIKILQVEKCRGKKTEFKKEKEI
jgi:hypothetical protein